MRDFIFSNGAMFQMSLWVLYLLTRYTDPSLFLAQRLRRSSEQLWFNAFNTMIYVVVAQQTLHIETMLF